MGISQRLGGPGVYHIATKRQAHSQVEPTGMLRPVSKTPVITFESEISIGRTLDGWTHQVGTQGSNNEGRYEADWHEKYIRLDNSSLTHSQLEMISREGSRKGRVDGHSSDDRLSPLTPANGDAPGKVDQTHLRNWKNNIIKPSPGWN